MSTSIVYHEFVTLWFLLLFVVVVVVQFEQRSLMIIYCIHMESQQVRHEIETELSMFFMPIKCMKNYYRYASTNKTTGIRSRQQKSTSNFSCHGKN